MPYSPRVKALAYEDDPGCWQSYSGLSPSFKRRVEKRRVRSLEAAQKFCDVMDRICPPTHEEPMLNRKYSSSRLFSPDQPRMSHSMSAEEALGTLFVLDMLSGGAVPKKAPLGEEATKAAQGATPSPKADVHAQGGPRVQPPLKIAMMLHFATQAERFAPERQRTSQAYSEFVRQLLNEGMIERPSDVLRAAHPGWAYRATAKGRAYVEALKHMALPEPTTTWSVPQ